MAIPIVLLFAILISQNLTVSKPLSTEIKEWSRKRTEELDYLNKVLQRENEGAQMHKDIESAMRDYWLATGGDQAKLNAVPKSYMFSNSKKNLI